MLVWYWRPSRTWARCVVILCAFGLWVPLLDVRSAQIFGCDTSRLASHAADQFVAGVSVRYINAVIVLMVVVLIYPQVSDWWLAHWVSEPASSRRDGEFLWIYALIVLGTIVLAIWRSVS